MFTFAYYPLLILLAAVAAWVFFRLKRKTPGLTYSHTHRLIRLTGNYSSLNERLPLILRALCLAFLVIAAARPQMYDVSSNTNSPGVDIMLCLDTSGSMQAMDFTLNGDRVNRLTAIKKVVTDFIKKREYDRIGLVVFGEEAFTQAPLTMDKGMLLGLVERMEIGMAGDRTNIGSAIAIGGKRLKELKAKARVMILLTDGRHNIGDITPEQAAEAVKAFGVKIYTIGVGGKGAAPFPVRGFFGTRLVPQEIDLDEDTLQKIADIVGGRYFRASDTQKLEEIYEIIDKTEKTEIKVREFFHFEELYFYFLIPALIFLILEVILKTTVLRVIP
jgi:Ca-activated chloride channel family protein